MWPLFVLGAIAFVPVIIACFTANKAVKGVLSVISFLGLLIFAFLTAGFLLPNYVGVNGIWLSFALCGAIYLVFMLFVWKPFTVKIRRITIFSITGILVILVAVFIVPPVYRESIPQASEEINLSMYTPFGSYWYVDGVLTHHESSVAKLNGKSSLNLSGDLPRLDGATALYPLYAAFVRAAYPAPEPNLDIPQYSVYGDFQDNEYGGSYLAVCSRTAGAFENLINGYADIIFLMGVSYEQRAMAEARGLELILTPIGREAFVFFVNSRNNTANLSVDDIKRIYTGEATNWREVGGANSEIRAYQRLENSGSQTMLKHVMGETPLAPAPMDEIFNTMMGMYERVASYRNYRNSLGYSFLFYINDMIGENKVKFLSINGIEPTRENILNGAYPFADNFYAITVKHNGVYLNTERTDNINRFLEWMLSPEGQYLVETTGYIPIH